MKILCVGDVHWSQNSSILRSRGEYYSTRLQNLIASVNWAEQTAWDNGCTTIIYLGDFFDSTQLNSEEISALSCIKWAPIPRIFITGNHETNVSSLDYSTCDVFSLCPSATVINKPVWYDVEDEPDLEFAFLPYILERDRKPLSEYFPKASRKRIIFSHNDLKDVQYGAFLSTEGFTLSEIHENCDLFVNGHIHNCAYVTEKIINSGNLTGQNFTEDATKYGHFVELIDTKTLEVKFIPNPYALNFAKIDATGDRFVGALPVKFNNAVLTIKVDSPETARAARESCDFNSNVIAYRLIVESKLTATVEDTPSLEAVDHLKQFEQYVLSYIGDTNVIREELQNVMR